MCCIASLVAVLCVCEREISVVWDNYSGISQIMGGTWWTDSEQLQLWGKSFSEAVWAVNVLQGLASVSQCSSMSWRWPSEVLFLQLLCHTDMHHREHPKHAATHYQHDGGSFDIFLWHPLKKTTVTVLSRPRERSHLKLVMQLGQVESSELVRRCNTRTQEAVYLSLSVIWMAVWPNGLLYRRSPKSALHYLFTVMLPYWSPPPSR